MVRVGEEAAVMLVLKDSPAEELIRPAWPISCCISSVALRTLECTWVRFMMVLCDQVMRIIPAMTVPATITRIASATSISSSEKPFCLIRLFIASSAFSKEQNLEWTRLQRSHRRSRCRVLRVYAAHGGDSHADRFQSRTGVRDLPGP